MFIKKLFVILLAAAMFLPVAHAQSPENDVLTKILLEKGVISAQQAEKIQQAPSQAMSAESRAIMVDILHSKGILTDEEVAAVKGASPALVSAPAPIAGEDTAATALASNEIVPVYDKGFRLRTKDGKAELAFKGLLQADYRTYDYDLEPQGIGTDPGTDSFDIRRARLITEGKFSPMLGFRLSYEFQGAGTRNLLDAYADARINDAFIIRVGQFKEPFGLEALTPDKDLFFSERSMGYDLNPKRDVGLMAHGSAWSDRVHYGAGIFNGDGMDDATGGHVDEPEVCARLGLSPFLAMENALVKGFHLGASGSYVRTDQTNVDLDIQTLGRTTFFSVATRAKFNIIRDCDYRLRHGADAAWTWGPVGLFGEYIQAKYNGVRTSSSTFDAEMTGIYASGAWMITGEPITVLNGKIQPIAPSRPIGDGGWGALGLAFRYDTFDAGDKVYETMVYKGDSVREAEAMALGLNWYLNRHARFLIEYSHTSFDEPLKIYRDSTTGTSLYSDKEDTISSRFQLGF